jgi:uncharacterized protein (DUF983 family)
MGADRQFDNVMPGAKQRCPHCGIPYSDKFFIANHGICAACGQSLVQAGAGALLLAAIPSALAWIGVARSSMPAPHPFRAATALTAVAFTWAFSMIVIDRKLGKSKRWIGLVLALMVGAALRGWGTR